MIRFLFFRVGDRERCLAPTPLQISPSLEENPEGNIAASAPHLTILIRLTPIRRNPNLEFGTTAEKKITTQRFMARSGR